MANSTILRQAIDLAHKSDFSRARLGAVLHKRNKVLGRGYNQVNRHQSVIRTPHWQGSLHAEVAALVDALKQHPFSELRKSELMVVRIGRGGDLLLSKPCQDCLEVVKNLGVIRKIVYSDEQGLLSEMEVNW